MHMHGVNQLRGGVERLGYFIITMDALAGKCSSTVAIDDNGQLQQVGRYFLYCNG